MAPESRFVGAVDRALYLGVMPGFAELEPEDLAVVAEHAQETFFKAGAVVLEAHEPVRVAHVVVEGALGLTGPGGRRVEVGPRESAGFLQMLAGKREGVAAVALADTLTLAFEADDIYDLMEDNFTVLIHQLRDLASRTLEVRRRIPAGALLSPQPETLLCPDRGLDLVERIVLLRNGPTFARASLDALADMAELMEEQRFPEGTRLWRAGEPSGYVLLLLSGIVSCTFAGESRYFRCGTGYPLGNLESLARRPRWFDAVAETPLIVLKADSDAFLDILEDHFEMAKDLVGAMASNLLQLQAGE